MSILSCNKAGGNAIVSLDRLVDKKDVVVLGGKRRNGQYLKFVAVKVSCNSDKWFWWLPTEQQLQEISKINGHIDVLNQINGK